MVNNISFSSGNSSAPQRNLQRHLQWQCACNHKNTLHWLEPQPVSLYYTVIYTNLKDLLQTYKILPRKKTWAVYIKYFESNWQLLYNYNNHNNYNICIMLNLLMPM